MTPTFGGWLSDRRSHSTALHARDHMRGEQLPRPVLRFGGPGGIAYQPQWPGAIPRITRDQASFVDQALN
jgi:hypothetical protein